MAFMGIHKNEGGPGTDGDWFLVEDAESFAGYEVVAINEGGFNATRIDLAAILDAVAKHAPELLDEYKLRSLDPNPEPTAREIDRPAT